MKHLYQNLYVAGQLGEADFEALKEAGVNTIINNRPDNEEAGQLSADEAAQLAKQNGIEYHHLPMANGQPLPENLVAEFKAIVANSNGSVLAHCRSGMRSSFIWALGAIPTGNVSVDQAIEAASSAGIPLNNAREALEQIAS